MACFLMSLHHNTPSNFAPSLFSIFWFYLLLPISSEHQTTLKHERVHLHTLDSHDRDSESCGVDNELCWHHTINLMQTT